MVLVYNDTRALYVKVRRERESELFPCKYVFTSLHVRPSDTEIVCWELAMSAIFLRKKRNKRNKNAQ